MQYTVDDDVAGEPSLAEMTSKAIDILKRNEKGFFLLVEGKLSHIMMTYALLCFTRSLQKVV